MRTSLKFYIVCLAWIAMAGCGSQSSKSSSGSTLLSPPYPSASLTNTGLNIVSGDNQTAIVGSPLSEPLTVMAYDSAGNPAPNKQINLSVKSGACILAGRTAITGADGKASLNVIAGGGLAPIQLAAASDSGASVVFTENSRLPILEEVVGGTVDGKPVGSFPAILATLDNGQTVLALLKGDASGVDLSFIPKARDLLGGLIKGVSAENYPVLFLPAASLAALINPPPAPKSSLIAANFMMQESSGNLPVVVSLKVNGGPAVVGILGNASGITTTTLGDLISAGAMVGSVPVSNLSVYLVNASDFPSNPASSYSALGSKVVPFFSAGESVTGASTATWAPVSSVILPTTAPALVVVSGAVSPSGLQLYNTPHLTGLSAPEASLYPLPEQFIPAFNVVQNELMPLLIASQPAQQNLQADMENLAKIFKDNQALLASFSSGQMPDLSSLGPLASTLLPALNHLMGDVIATLPTINQTLGIVESDLLPAIATALPPDGGAFGGYTTGAPSTIRDDVLPYIGEQIDNMQAAMPTVTKLLHDIQSLIPADGNLLTLLGNIQGGGLQNVMNDVQALKAYLVDGLIIFQNHGMPILYNMLDQAQHDFPAGQSPISGTEMYQQFLDSLHAALPADTTLGDLPGFSQIAPMLAQILPASLCDPAGISLFNTVLPAIGQVDIGADILPVMKTGLDQLNAALPGIILNIQNFDLSIFSLHL